MFLMQRVNEQRVVYKLAGYFTSKQVGLHLALIRSDRSQTTSLPVADNWIDEDGRPIY